MTKFSILDQKHEQYDPECFERLSLLFKGGQEIIDNARIFMPQGLLENDRAYQARLRCASYNNYLANIVRKFVDGVFEKDLTVMPEGQVALTEPFYREFVEDADQCSNSLESVCAQLLESALVHKRGLLGVDFPNAKEAALTLADEERLGISRAYVYHIPLMSLIDWEVDEFGNFVWCRLKREFLKPGSPFDTRNIKVTQFKVWMIEGDQVKWQMFEIETKLSQTIGASREVPMIAEGVTSFKRIPILKLELPESLWVGNLIGTKCADHFKFQSNLFHAQDRSLYAAPVYKQGAEYQEVPGGGESISVIGENEHRGREASSVYESRGFMVIGPQDEVSFMEPEGKAYQLVNEELKEMVDEIYRIVHQMSQSVSATTHGEARSAASKNADNRSTEILYAAYGAFVRRFAKELFTCISEARNEQIVWEPRGLNNYQITDREQLTKEVMAASVAVSVVPSPEWQALYLHQLAMQLTPGLSAETEAKIKKELEQAAKAGLMMHQEEDQTDQEEDDQQDKGSE